MPLPMGTTLLPSGSSASGTIFQQAMPNGIRIIVITGAPRDQVGQRQAPAHDQDQTMLPSTDQKPASRSTTTVRPNGQTT